MTTGSSGPWIDRRNPYGRTDLKGSIGVNNAILKWAERRCYCKLHTNGYHRCFEFVSKHEPAIVINVLADDQIEAQLSGMYQFLYVGILQPMLTGWRAEPLEIVHFTEITLIAPAVDLLDRLVWWVEANTEIVEVYGGQRWIWNCSSYLQFSSISSGGSITISV